MCPWPRSTGPVRHGPHSPAHSGRIPGAFRAHSGRGACDATPRAPSAPQSSAAPTVGRQAAAATTPMSSLKERAGVKRGLACRFAVVWGYAGHGGMASWRVSPDWCRVRASRLGGSRTGRSPAAQRRRKASLTRGPASRYWLARGRAAGCGKGGGYAVVGGPIGRCAARGRPAGCRHPFAVPGLAGRERMGPVRVRSGRGSITYSSAPPQRGTHIVTAARPAGPAAGHAAGRQARRTCPSRRA